jgi:uncharacterized membrane protein YccC
VFIIRREPKPENSETTSHDEAGTPSQRLLADQAAKVLAGLSHVLEALALLVDAPGEPPARQRGFRLSVPDWMPAVVNAARAFLAIGAIELFWVATAWPDGVEALVLVAIMLLLLSPRGDMAFGGAIAFALGAAGGFVAAAIMKFAVLPALQTFPAFCVAKTRRRHFSRRLVGLEF